MTTVDSDDLLQKINQLPDLSDTEKAYLREQLTAKKKYGLIWENKPELVEQQLLNSLPVLTEIPERRIENKVLPTESSNLSVSATTMEKMTRSDSATPNGQTILAFNSEKSASLVD